MALPAVVLLLACCLSGIGAAGQQLRLADAAALAARTLARGGDPEALVSRLAPGARVGTQSEGDLACVVLTAPANGPLPVGLSARSCALGGGR
ncbi:hypothetical protein BH09ACT5_BH09ACT5_12210 [soil metagenome]